MSWQKLQQRFREIVLRADGPGKSTSGDLTITYDFNGEISVTMGTYDISYWPRQTFIGPFSTEEEALRQTAAKLDEAERAVEKDLAESKVEDWDDDPNDQIWSEELPQKAAVEVIEEDSVCHCKAKCVCGHRFSYGLE